MFRLNDTNVQFMAYRRQWVWISAIITAICIAGIALRGFNFGIDFTGGLVVELGYEQPVEIEPLRQQLTAAGFEQAVVQHFGSSKDVMVRTATQPEVSQQQLTEQVVAAMTQGGQAVQLRRVEYVGPQVGDELATDGALAMLAAMIMILIYTTLRYEFRFALGAVLGVAHDVVIVLGVLAWTQSLFDLSVLAAVLAVIGFSINDTIVIFDRVRENFRALRGFSPPDVMNISLNQTLARTIMTSLTIFMVAAVLFVFGGEAIHIFALVLIIGIVAGTYSSVYVASSLALALGATQEDLVRKDRGKSREAVDDDMKAEFLAQESTRREA